MHRDFQQPRIAIWLFSLLLVLTAGCAPNLARTDFRDLRQLPQEPRAYLEPDTAERQLITSSRQRQMTAEFLDNHFAAWHTAQPLATTRHPFWAVDWVQNREVYGANLRPVDQRRIRELIRQVDRPGYPSLDRRAITLRSTSLRALPTHRPFFNDPREAGEGFPFDNLQHSTLPANVPLHVLHLARDGDWAFVETALVYGWMPIHELAWVDDAFVGNFQDGDFLALTNDDIPVFDTEDRFRFLTRIGMLLPVRGSRSGQHRVLLAGAGLDRQAVLLEGSVAPESGETFPLLLSPANLAGLAGRMVGQLYGWGGSFGGRDCSALMRDLFAPFGLWLPRNSSRQAQVGEVIELAELAARQRESRILEQGVPWLTLVRLPGHIMLYLGEYRQRAVFLHSLWGVRTRDFWGDEGRWVVGRTVITTLEPGLERTGMTFEVGRLLARVDSMNILTPVQAAEELAADRKPTPD